MLRILLSFVVYSSMAIGAKAASGLNNTTDTFLGGLGECAFIQRNPLAFDVFLTDRVWSQLPLMPGNYQKNGVRLFRSLDRKACHLQTAAQVDLKRVTQVLEVFGRERPAIKRLSWDEARRRPVSGDTYRVWRWESREPLGLFTYEVNVLPGATAPRPGEQAITATVTLAPATKAIQAPASLRDPGAAPMAFENAFVAMTAACEMEMKSVGLGQGSAIQKIARELNLTAQGQGFEWRREGRVVTIERRDGGICKVIARGDTMKAAYVRQELAKRLVGYTQGEPLLRTIPEMGSRYDNWVLPFENRMARSISLVHLQENRAATVKAGPDDFALVSTADHYQSMSQQIPPEGPLIIAAIETMTSCLSVNDKLGESLVRGGLRHVRDRLDKEYGRVLDQAELRIRFVGDMGVTCEVMIDSRPADDQVIYRAFDSFLASFGQNIERKLWRSPVSVSGIPWDESRINLTLKTSAAALNGLRKGITLRRYPQKRLGGSTGPRFVFQIGVQHD